MAPLIILLGTFVILFLLDRAFLGRRFGVSLMGRISLSAMLFATGISHFWSTDLLVEIMPEAVPFKREIVYFTGICELLAIPGLLWTKTARLTSIVLVIFFLAILPANIVGSLKQVQLGGMEYGAMYLLFRVPLQMFFILWVWFFGVRRSNYA